MSALLCALADFDRFNDFGTEEKGKNLRLVQSFKKLKEAADKFTEECFAFEKKLHQWVFADYLEGWTAYYEAENDDNVDVSDDYVESCCWGFPDKKIAFDYLTAPKIAGQVELELRDMADKGETPNNAYYALIVDQMQCENENEDGEDLDYTLRQETQGPKARATRRLELLSKRTGEPASQKTLRDPGKPIRSWTLLYFRSTPRNCGYDNVWNWARAVIPLGRTGGKPDLRKNVWRILRKLCSRRY